MGESQVIATADGESTCTAVSSSYAHRIDPVLKAQGEVLFVELGMSLGTVINVFLKKAVRVRGFPFDVSLDEPSKETLVAILEAERVARDDDLRAYGVDEALAELKR